MKLYSENKDYKLYNGNMLDMLEVIEPNSIDSVITDPPYELNFMNKGWDNSGIAFQPDTWKKCYEVLKPGGYLLAFGGSRTFHRIACAIEDAGFEIRDTIMWLYGSGFPKSMDISKQIDKRGGESTSWFGEYLKNTLKEKNMTYSDLAKHFLSKTGGITGCVHNWVEGKNMPTIEQFNKICEILDLPFKKMEEAEREVIGKKEKLESYQYKNNNVYQTNGNKDKITLDITTPATSLAKQWEGWGTALKPSFEPIIVARKPFKGSLVDNVIEYGVGGINIDECRVGNEIIKGGTMPKMNSQSDGINLYNFGKKDAERLERQDSIGRFPANTILTYDETDFDEVCGGFPYTKSGGGDKSTKCGNTFLGTGYGGTNTNKYEANEGSASRYFYCAKASKRDRDEGLPNKWLDNLELILYNNIGDELWKDKITIKEENKAKHLEDMEVSLQKVIEEYGIQTKKDIDLNTLLYGKKSLEKYLKENKYTTKTEINSTTVSQILNLLTLYTTKENTQDAKLEMENGTNLVEIVENTNQLEIIIKENQELVPGANNVVLKMLLKINEKEGRNEHCTVKPTSLMQYLVRLVTPKGGVVLDPFNGSGSTGKAVMYENYERNKNYKYIGIELTEEYLPISKARIEYVSNLEPEQKEPTIFDFMEEENDKD